MIKSILSALIANILIAIAKVIGAFLTNSGAMLSEAIHSFADTGNQILLLIGRKQSKNKATKEHPYGFGNESYFYSLIVGVMLFLVGGIYNIYHNASNLMHINSYSESKSIFFHIISLVILIIALFLESLALRTTLKESKKDGRKKYEFWHYLRTTKTAEFIVLLIEDSAACIGLVVAIIGISLSMLTGNYIFDTFSGIIIGLLLCFSAVFLFIECKSLLIGESPSDKNMYIAKKIIEQHSFIVKEIKGIHLSTNNLLITAYVSPLEGYSMNELTDSIEEAKIEIKKTFPYAQIYIEIVK